MKIFDYEEIKMNWDSFTYPIAVGTPVSVDGVLADNSSAHGLIARTVFAKPDGGDTLKVMTGGFIDMEEIVAGYGQELSSAAVQALCGIHFYKDGVCIPTGGSGGGDDSQKWKEETSTPLFNETVTTEAVEGSDYSLASLVYQGYITDDALEVVFDGNKYFCPKTILYEGTNAYGAQFGETGVDFSEFPFAINSVDSGDCEIITQTSGTHTVSVISVNYTYTTTFINAVKKLFPKGVADGEGELSVILGAITDNTATGDYACAEGVFTNATGYASHTEGQNTTASALASHAEGQNTTASGSNSHAEGEQCIASGVQSHSEGNGSQATGENAHAQNEYTIAQGRGQTVIGRNNVAQGNSGTYIETDYAFIIGNGLSRSERSNAFAVRWDGAIVLANGAVLTVEQLAKVATLT